ncbi:MAG: TetR/AcrR family transcriptional regulator [Porticoccaceae bacterium]|jgi:AcrR family transcriptional regulator|nr:TetR/AcrR family transcriptional regulator [Porticoccaceae bacterium]
MKRLSQTEKTQLTRSRLKQSALKSFAKKGVNSTGIEEIARGAGYSKGAFYGNYSSKFELLLDALEEKQLSEVRFWKEVMESAGDPDQGLAALTKRYVDAEPMLERTLLSIELQLEADRNPEFEEAFKGYLDALYEEMRKLLTTTLARMGKAPPPSLDTILVTVRLLGIGLGSQTILGNEIGSRTQPVEIMLDFLRGVIASSPPLKDGEEHAAATVV